jgi:hypothetical protein
MSYADAAACKEADKWRASIYKEVHELLCQGTFKVVNQEKWMCPLPLK